MIGEILQLIALISVFCGLIVVYFFVAVYISLKKFGGTLERRHMYVILGLAVLFFVISIVLNVIGSLITI